MGVYENAYVYFMACGATATPRSSLRVGTCGDSVAVTTTTWKKNNLSTS